jgi:hypothetical protein
MRPTPGALDMGQLELMWNYLKMGEQKANKPALLVLAKVSM